jgi:hypothetical protein
MYLIFNTHSSDEHYNGDCDCALVELTPTLVEQVRGRVALARQAGQQDDDLNELYFWGGTAQFYDHNVLEACQDAAAAAAHGADPDQAARDWLVDFEQREYAVVPEGVDFTAHEVQRTEVDQMIVRCSPSSRDPHYEIAWTASPKHSDVYVTTCDLPLKRLEELLAAEHRPDGNPSNAGMGRTCLS